MDDKKINMTKLDAPLRAKLSVPRGGKMNVMLFCTITENANEESMRKRLEDHYRMNVLKQVVRIADKHVIFAANAAPVSIEAV